MKNIRVEAEAEVRPTEDPEKVATALGNVLSGNFQKRVSGENRFLIQIQGNDLSSLGKFRLILERDRIRAAARAIMHRALEGQRIVLFLNKQAAYAGHVSFSQPEGESPLGPIRLVIKTEDPLGIINWLTGGHEERVKK